MIRPGFLRFLAGCFLIVVPFFLHPVRAAGFSKSPLPGLIHNGGYAVLTGAGKEVGFKVDTAFVPASTIKLLTCAAALSILGPDYRFKTRFFLDSSGDLIIQGNGDPTLTSEEVRAIAKRLAADGLRRIRALVLNVSAFSLKTGVDGSDHSENPYDVEVGPLAVNFNALPLKVSADGRIGSGEKQTPILPMMRLYGRTLQPGLYRLNVCALPPSGPLGNELTYTLELFKAMFAEQGIAIKAPSRQGTIPDGAKLFYVHQSEPLREIIRRCLEFSNNFIANELFLACGRKRFGSPATWRKARMAIKQFIKQRLKTPPGAITVIEGSGLSRKDRITPQAMLTVLKTFSPFADLLPIKHDIPVKSGTLTGVYCYAGYLGKPGNTTPFVIMLNQKANNRDRILDVLKARFR